LHFQVGHQIHRPGQKFIRTARWREFSFDALEVVDRQSKLFQVVETLGSTSRLADHLHGRQQQADQDPDNGDYHQ
jgi:hypothetical protein